MSRIQPKIIWHVKKQEHMTYAQERRKSLKTDLEVTQMLEWADKDFEVAIINIFRDVKEKHLLMNEQQQQKTSVGKQKLLNKNAPTGDSKTEKYNIWN